MNNKKNYYKGTRRDIIYLLHNTGLLTSAALNVLPNSSNKPFTYQRKINEMLKEGHLTRHLARGMKYKRVITMNDYDKLSGTYAVNIPQRCIDEYLTNYQDDLRKVWSKAEADYGRPVRIVKAAETALLAYGAGLNTFVDQPKTENHYFSSREIKNYINYSDDVEQATGEAKKIGFTKANGLVVSSGGNYAIYNVDRDALPKLSFGEAKLKNNLYLVAKRIQKNDTLPVEGLLVLDDMSCINDYLACMDIDSYKFSRTQMFFKTYDRLYAIPYDANGRDMLWYMTHIQNWKERLIKAATGEVQDTKFCNIPCNHYDKDTNTATLTFLIPDVERLYMFNEVLADRDGRHRVICFDYQFPLVAAVIGDKADILTTSFEKYMTHIKEEFDGL